MKNRKLVQHIRDNYPKLERIISICSGSLLLAKSGILDGKLATSHWTRTPILSRQFPAVHWRPDEIFTRDGNIYCSAGVTAGIDLSLALLEEDHGRGLALEVARELVVYMRRSGGQARFSQPLRAQSATSSRLATLCNAICSQPARPWTLADMCGFANLTERTLHRHFVKEMGESPSSFVESLRLDVARSLLESDARNIARIAAESGFSNEQSFRRSFVKRFSISPNLYRERFGPGK